MPRENVRISDAGYRLLNDKELADRVAKVIMDRKDDLKHGSKIEVEGSGLSIQLVTSLDEQSLSSKRDR